MIRIYINNDVRSPSMEPKTERMGSKWKVDLIEIQWNETGRDTSGINSRSKRQVKPIYPANTSRTSIEFDLSTGILIVNKLFTQQPLLPSRCRQCSCNKINEDPSLEWDFSGCDAFSKAKVILRRHLPWAARMRYKKLRVQLQGVSDSVTGYRVKEDGEDKKKTKNKKHTYKWHKEPAWYESCKTCHAACPGGVVLGYV